MNPQTVNVVAWVQILVSVVTLLSVAFGAGRVLEKLETTREEVRDLKVTLFGADGRGEGTFMRRAEAQAWYDESKRDRAQLHEAIEELRGATG